MLLVLVLVWVVCIFLKPYCSTFRAARTRPPDSIAHVSSLWVLSTTNLNCRIKPQGYHDNDYKSNDAAAADDDNSNHAAGSDNVNQMIIVKYNIRAHLD